MSEYGVHLHVTRHGRGKGDEGTILAPPPRRPLEAARERGA